MRYIVGPAPATNPLDRFEHHPRKFYRYMYRTPPEKLDELKTGATPTSCAELCLQKTECVSFHILVSMGMCMTFKNQDTCRELDNPQLFTATMFDYYILKVDPAGQSVMDCSVEGKADGEYQSSRACNMYVSCMDGRTFDGRKCPEGKLWDDVAKECADTSSTCTDSILMGDDPAFADMRNACPIELFSEPDYTGERRQSEIGMKDLSKFDWDNKAKSIRVTGSGEWLVCSEADSQGDCTLLGVGDHNQANLHSTSSIKRKNPFCVLDCTGKENGDYQSCRGCGQFVTCTSGALEEKPCSLGLIWDDRAKICRDVSYTCGGDYDVNEDDNSIILYDHNLSGRYVLLHQDQPDLTDLYFNNIASSLLIPGHVKWEVCKSKDYTGDCTLYQGPNSFQLTGSNDNAITSAIMKGGVHVDKLMEGSPSDRVVFFSGDNHDTKLGVVMASTPDLELSIQDKVQSLTILGGSTWRIFCGTNYDLLSDYEDFPPGSYTADQLGDLQPNCASSAMKLPSPPTIVGDYVVLYQKDTCRGASLLFQDSHTFVGQEFNDKAKCVAVHGGDSWRFFEQPNYQGRFFDLSVGSSPLVTEEKSVLVSSFKRLSPDSLYMSKFVGCSGSQLEGHDDRLARNTASLPSCAKECDKWQSCKSFDYNPLTLDCFLSKDSRYTQPDSFLTGDHAGSMFHYVHRQRRTLHCPRNAIIDNESGRCYTYISEPKNYHDAARYCYQLQNGFLATFTDKVIIEKFRSMLPDTGIPDNYWLGGISKDTKNYWLRGSHLMKMEYTNWLNEAASQASGNNKCVQADSTSEHKWQFDDCEQPKPFLCEFVPNGIGVDFLVKCPPGWSLYGGQCYRLFNHETVTYYEARERCQSKQADLVTIQTEGAQSFLRTYMEKVWKNDETAVWIGASDAQQELSYTWVDGCAFQYVRFLNLVSETKMTVPNPINNCLVMTPQQSMFLTWTDKACTDNYFYMCQARAGQVDSDDCATNLLTCPDNSDCVDSSSYSHCACKSGFLPVTSSGVLVCEKADRCVASGDPHYNTFDNQVIHFQGTCMYLLSGLCPGMNDGTIPDFQVEVKNLPSSRIARPTVTFTRRVYIKIAGHVIQMRQGRILLVDGARKNAPYQIAGTSIKIHIRGLFLTLTTDFGLLVEFDGNHYVSVGVPPAYHNKLCGLCGNNNNVKTDDLYPKGMSSVASYTDVGNSWEVPDNSGLGNALKCVRPPGDDEVICTAAENSIYSDTEHCGAILLLAIFEQCHLVIDPQSYFASCRMDQCATEGSEVSLCESLSTYAEACEQALNTQIIWQSQSLCPPSCGPNMHYEPDMTACPATCVDMFFSITCDSANRPGCACNPGHVLSGDSCIKYAQCGCLDMSSGNADYKQPGETWGSDDCSKRYHCEEGSGIRTEPMSCHENAKCALDDGGEHGCHCKDGYIGDGIDNCRDINECSTGDYTCPPESNCHNTEGGYECKCVIGFTMVNGLCIDVNECVRNDDDCNVNCVNDPGTYHCECEHGVNSKKKKVPTATLR